jgi:hypothetical protein
MKRPCLVLLTSLVAFGQSSYKYSVKGDEKTVEITNVNYEVTNSGLVLRETTKSKQTLGDIGVEATTTTEAWKLGVDMKQKPIYSVTVPATSSRIVEEVFVVARGLEENDWWSIYNISTGARLFDTHAPMVIVPINPASVKLRYVGLEAIDDEHLKEPHMVAVLTYASESKVIREALITCDDPKQAALRRSFADQTRELYRSGTTLHLTFSGNYPSPPATINFTIPIAGDDLDLAHAQVPLHFKIVKR